VLTPPGIAAALVLLPVFAFTAQAQPAAMAGAPPPAQGRMRLELAGGPAFEVATAGERGSERGLMAAPSLSIRVGPWFEYVLEGHVSHYVAPEDGTVLGIVPAGFRLHSRGRTQAYLSAGAGLAWTDFEGLRGLDRRRNYLTQIGAGVRRVREHGDALSVEARFFHLSNLSSAPPNLGIEVFAVLVGYRLPGR
jgi:hypothetical protein